MLARANSDPGEYRVVQCSLYKAFEGPTFVWTGVDPNG